MNEYATLVLVVLLALDVYMVSTTRLDACIRASVLQSFVLAALPLALSGIGGDGPPTESLNLVILAGATQVAKGILIPWLLFRGLRGLGSNREFEPFVSLHYSQFINGALIGCAFWVASALPWPTAHANTPALGVALATLLIGLYMTINRKKTISQVLGYLVIESGLFVAGWTLLEQPSLLVELGILLDLLVAAMVMGILATNMEGPEERAEAEEGTAPQPEGHA